MKSFKKPGKDPDYGFYKDEDREYQRERRRKEREREERKRRDRNFGRQHDRFKNFDDYDDFNDANFEEPFGDEWENGDWENEK